MDLRFASAGSAGRTGVPDRYAAKSRPVLHSRDARDPPNGDLIPNGQFPS